MALPVELSPHAVLDLEEIAAHIAADDPAAAERSVIRLAMRARKVDRFPRADRMVREYGAPTIREVLLGNDRIIYRLEAARGLVLKFLEGHKPALRR